MDNKEDLKEEDVKSKKERDILDLDLVRGEIVNVFDFKKNIFLFFVVISLSLILVFITYLSVLKWGDSQIKIQQAEYSEKISYVNNIIIKTRQEAEKVFDFQKKVVTVEKYLDTHLYQSNFFEFLENHILDDVYFLNYSKQSDNVYVFSAKATNVGAVGAQVEKFLSSNQVKSASVDGVIIGGSDNKGENVTNDQEIKEKEGDAGRYPVSFNITVEVDPNIVYKNF